MSTLRSASAVTLVAVALVLGVLGVSQCRTVAPETTHIELTPPAPEPTRPDPEDLPAEPEAAPQEPAASVEVETLARIETSMGLMVVELYEDQVPNTVASFVHLASKGFYDGLIFHRVIPDFMIQGGCPNGRGNGDPGYRFADEFARNLGHEGAGVLSMANSGPNTNGSQFFVTLKATPWLDGRHSVFGRVVEGADVLMEIGSVPTARGNRPVTPVTITKVTITIDGQPVTEVQSMPETL